MCRFLSAVAGLVAVCAVCVGCRGPVEPTVSAVLAGTASGERVSAVRAVRAAPTSTARAQSPRATHSGVRWPADITPTRGSGTPAPIQNTTSGSGGTPTAAASPTPGDRPIPGAFTFNRPFASGFERRGSAFFPYGTDANGQYLLHHGIDIGNAAGTPVLAVGAGEVVYAGADSSVIFGPTTDFYGILVVLRHDRGSDSESAAWPAVATTELYSLYGHLSRVTVKAGQHVAVGERVGEVGATGVALGPHLHLEFRMRPRDYEKTFNPALFLRPLPDTGTVIGRLVAASGHLVPRSVINLYRVVGSANEFVGATVSYPDRHVNPAPGWDENFVFADLPAGTYATVPAGRRMSARDLVTVTASAATRVTVTQ